VPGGADRSYGIHVAELAGIPKVVVNRARTILGELEASPAGRAPVVQEAPMQLTFFEGPNPVMRELREIDVEALTPIEAITRLFELRKLAGG
jgi:DNA mismatch repair protein MutS